MLTDDDKKWIKSAVSDGIVEALEELIIPQFEKISGQFEQVDKRFAELEKQVGYLEVKTDSILRIVVRIEDRLDNHDEKFDDHEHRLVHLETTKRRAPTV